MNAFSEPSLFLFSPARVRLVFGWVISQQQWQTFKWGSDMQTHHMWQRPWRVKKMMGYNLTLKIFFMPLSVSAAPASLSYRVGSVQGAAPALPLCYGHAQSLPSLPHSTGVWSRWCRHAVQLCSGRLQPSITGWDFPMSAKHVDSQSFCSTENTNWH